MRHRVDTFKIGRTSAHRRAMLANMTTSLVMEERIKTTVVKAKELRKFVAKLIKLARKAAAGDLSSRRKIISILKIKTGREPYFGTKSTKQDAVSKLIDEIVPRFEERNGGYTRIIKMDRRLGDGAEMCLIELLSNSEETSSKEKIDTSAEKKSDVKDDLADLIGELEEETPAEEVEEEKAEATPEEEKKTGEEEVEEEIEEKEKAEEK